MRLSLVILSFFVVISTYAKIIVTPESTTYGKIQIIKVEYETQEELEKIIKPKDKKILESIYVLEITDHFPNSKYLNIRGLLYNITTIENQIEFKGEFEAGEIDPKMKIVEQDVIVSTDKDYKFLWYVLVLIIVLLVSWLLKKKFYKKKKNRNHPLIEEINKDYLNNFVLYKRELKNNFPKFSTEIEEMISNMGVEIFKFKTEEDQDYIYKIKTLLQKIKVEYGI